MKQPAPCGRPGCNPPAYCDGCEGEGVRWSYDRHTGLPRATIHADGFDLEARVVPDDDGDFSYLGRVVHKPVPGVVCLGRGARDRTYVLPEYTAAQRRHDLQRLGYAKGPAEEIARAQVREDAKRLLSMGDEWCAVGLVVKAGKLGVELGEASVWSLASDDDGGRDLYLPDLVREACDEAREKLTALRAA
jgi:hypothetical protein